jgi:hypothetical protein
MIMNVLNFLLNFIYHAQSINIQSGSNMTGTNCDLFTHNQSRSYLNHLVHHEESNAERSSICSFHYLLHWTQNENLSLVVVAGIWRNITQVGLIGMKKPLEMNLATNHYLHACYWNLNNCYDPTINTREILIHDGQAYVPSVMELASFHMWGTLDVAKKQTEVKTKRFSLWAGWLVY